MQISTISEPAPLSLGPADKRSPFPASGTEVTPVIEDKLHILPREDGRSANPPAVETVADPVSSPGSREVRDRSGDSPRVLDLQWSERQEQLERESRKPSSPIDPEQDYQEAQKVWLQMLTGRQKHQEDLQEMMRETQLYIFQSIQESYLRQVKVLQKLMQAWQKVLFDWD